MYIVFFCQDLEEKQLRWEHREVELERTIARLETQVNKIAGAASQVREYTYPYIRHSFFYQNGIGGDLE